MSPRHHPWSRDELLLALDLYFRLGGMIPETHPEVISLSQLLRRMPLASKRAGDPRYRSTGSVHLKLQNFLAIDPAHTRPAMQHGSEADELLWSEFAADRAALRRLAAKIREALSTADALDETDPDEDDFPEGRVLYRLHRRLERRRDKVQSAKAAFIRRHGRLFCEACEFDFERTYGDRGRHWIEAHHDVPVSELGPDGRTNLRDLKMVCANCHRMLHRRRPWLRVSELGSLLASRAEA